MKLTTRNWAAGGVLVALLLGLFGYALHTKEVQAIPPILCVKGLGGPCDCTEFSISADPSNARTEKLAAVVRDALSLQGLTETRIDESDRAVDGQRVLSLTIQVASATPTPDEREWIIKAVCVGEDSERLPVCLIESLPQAEGKAVDSRVFEEVIGMALGQATGRGAGRFEVLEPASR